MSNSECFSHDAEVRQSWVPLVSSKVAKQLKSIAPAARMKLYKEVDLKVKQLYIKTLAEANKDPIVVHMKGLGLVRKARNQLNRDQVIADCAAIVVQEMFGDA